MRVGRLLWLDHARAFAIISIVFCHVVECIYPWISPSYSGQFERTIYFTIGRLGVPIFLMLSGYLLLSRHQVTNLQEYMAFLKKKWVPLLICYEVWIVIYNLFLFIYRNQFDTTSFVQQLTFQRFPDFSHWWYMPMIVGMYLFIPMLSVMKQYLGKRFIEWVFFISVLVHVLFPITSRKILLDLSYFGSCYLTYILFGYVCFLNIDKIKRYLINPWSRLYKVDFPGRVRAVVLCLLTLVLYGVCVYVQIRTYGKNSPYFIWYDNPYLILCSFGLFLCFLFLNNVSSKLAIGLSMASFPIYLIHNIVILVIGGSVKQFEISDSLKSSVLLLVTLFVCFMLYKILSVNNKVSRVLFLR